MKTLPLFLIIFSIPSLAGSPKTELHWSVCEPTPQAALRALGVAAERKPDREVSFLEDRDQALYESGVILRVREKTKHTVTTAKIRGLEARQVRPHWLKQDGFKCEQDCFGERCHPTCSFDNELPAGAEARFTSDQKDFLAEYGARAVEWTRLNELGPVRESSWELAADTPDRDSLSLEADALPDGTYVMELSDRVDSSDADRRFRSVSRWLDERGVQLCATSESKTEKLLKALSRR